MPADCVVADRTFAAGVGAGRIPVAAACFVQHCCMEINKYKFIVKFIKINLGKQQNNNNHQNNNYIHISSNTRLIASRIIRPVTRKQRAEIYI